MKRIWECRECNDVVISDSKQHHTMNSCNCGKTSVDLEELYIRIIGNPKFLIKKVDHIWVSEL